MKNKEEWTISYKQIGLIIFSFFLGCISAFLISNSQSASTTSFSTTELIGFVLSVILSGASIVLAISAIALGKSSEKSVIDRSDESIRLQNEVFIRTTEALQRIEASTGVTEKRIEDIITGRVGDISQKIAGLASEAREKSGHSKKDLEEEIKSTLMRAIKGSSSVNSSDDIETKMKERELRENIYLSIHNTIMDYIKNIAGIVVGKIGHGSPNKKGDDQIDSIFTLDNKRIGVSTFREDVEDTTLDIYFRGAANQIEKGNFLEIIALSIDGVGFEEKAKEILKPFKDELKEKIRFKEIASANLSKSVIEDIISNKSIQSTAKASAD